MVSRAALAPLTPRAFTTCAATSSTVVDAVRAVSPIVMGHCAAEPGQHLAHTCLEFRQIVLQRFSVAPAALPFLRLRSRAIIISVHQRRSRPCAHFNAAAQNGVPT